MDRHLPAGKPSESMSFWLMCSTSSSKQLLSGLDKPLRISHRTDSDQPGALAHGLAKSLGTRSTPSSTASPPCAASLGDLLNQAERMSNTLLARNEQVEAQRVAAEDYDAEGMVEALSQLKTQETAVSAALQSYASIQKLSLFNYIN